MCSIFGIGFLQGHKFKNESTLIGVISRLFKAAEVAGRRAAGLSIMREKSVHILRRPVPASGLVASEEYIDFMSDNLKIKDEENRVMSVVGHCRLPTQGDPSNNLNNHPQVVDNIIGVHNGVIGNDHEIFDMFKEVIVRKAEVDTEVIFQLISHFSKGKRSRTISAIKKATPYLRGSFACGMQNTRHPYNLYLFRHGNSINILNYNEMGLLFFATREYFITTAFDEFVDYSGEGTPIDLVENQGIAFNLWDKTMCKFLFKDWRAAEELKKQC